MSVKTTKAELQATINDLTGKLRGSIAQANRHFDRIKQLELECNELKALLREHGIEYKSKVVTLVSSKRAEFMKLATEHGFANVQIKNGRIQVRKDNEWVEVTA